MFNKYNNNYKKAGDYPDKKIFSHSKRYYIF